MINWDESKARHSTEWSINRERGGGSAGKHEVQQATYSQRAFPSTGQHLRSTPKHLEWRCGGVAVWRCPAYADSDASLSIRQGDRLVLGTRLRAAHVTTCRKAWPHQTWATPCVSSARAARAFGGCRANLESGFRNRQQPCRALARAPQFSSVPAGRALSPTRPLPLCDQTDVYLPYRSNQVVFDKAASTRAR